jgi:RNA polymerase sigma factor
LRGIDEKAVDASNDEAKLNRFILEYEAYILKCASKTSRRFITKSDDEWSIALEAFCSAVKTYSYEKGSFFGHAELLISRRLIDFFRVQSRHRAELPVSHAVLSGELEEDSEDAALASEIVSKANSTSDNPLGEEIDAVNLLFHAYGFSFYDLIACSPKSKKTREACRKAVSYMISSPLLVNEMRRSKNLPLKIIENQAGIPRKILERHRKYIIAAIEIITGDYPGLSEYMRTLREGLDI